MTGDVNYFGITEDFDNERFACDCGVVWRLYPYASASYAVPNSVLSDRVHLAVQVDDGLIQSQWLTWRCACGLYLVVSRPTYDVVLCEWCRRDETPSDFYTNPRHGQACACCGRNGRHQVRRGSGEVPACRRVEARA